MIPISSLYPTELDTDDNLFEVHDSIRMKLIEDYVPGNTSIKVEIDFVTDSRIPETGLITLTEQCSDIDKRAISFYYSAYDSDTSTFSGLELLPEFVDVVKPKDITNVTMNVMSRHHNHIKNALIEIQKFAGKEGLEDIKPFGPTLEGRINFLRRLVLQPKAWFTADVKTGNVPLEVEFTNMSFRLGTDGTADEVKLTWDFGDGTYETNNGDKTIIKTYHQGGLFTVKLRVENNFGYDECVFEDFISARIKAPNEAVVKILENTSVQELTEGVPPNGPFDVYPKIRSPINSIIEMSVPQEENTLGTPGYTYGGEAVNTETGEPFDPIVSYNWIIGDDLSHPDNYSTSAAFSIGGIYDLKLRVDTEFGAYRITTYPDAFDIVENFNLWMWNIDESNLATSYEFGLISETFKVAGSTYAVNVDDSFLNAEDENLQTMIKHEFSRNTGFTLPSTTSSGGGGNSIIYWASGRSEAAPASSEKINSVNFNGLTQTYTSRSSLTRTWNWVNLNSLNKSYFIFGTSEPSPNYSPTNDLLLTVDLSDDTFQGTTPSDANYLNGAQELRENVAVFDSEGNSVYGNYSVYKSAWKDDTGYIARNDAVGPFFRIKSFYRTEGTISNPFINIRKLQDIQGPTKLNAELTNLSTGIYVLNNSGSISKYDDSSSSWSTGGPGVNSLLYRSLQDTNVVGYDNLENSLLLASDSDKRAYLSFDYSANAFLRFSEIDLTFTSIGSRPEGRQWVMSIY